MKEGKFRRTAISTCVPRMRRFVTLHELFFFVVYAYFTNRFCVREAILYPSAKTSFQTKLNANPGKRRRSRSIIYANFRFALLQLHYLDFKLNSKCLLLNFTYQ